MDLGTLWGNGLSLIFDCLFGDGTDIDKYVCVLSFCCDFGNDNSFGLFNNLCDTKMYFKWKKQDNVSNIN